MARRKTKSRLPEPIEKSPPPLLKLALKLWGKECRIPVSAEQLKRLTALEGNAYNRFLRAIVQKWLTTHPKLKERQALRSLPRPHRSPPEQFKAQRTARQALDVSARTTLQGLLEHLPDWQRDHVGALLDPRAAQAMKEVRLASASELADSISPSTLLRYIREGSLDSLDPRQRRALDALTRALKALRAHWTPARKNLEKVFGSDRTMERIPDETMNRIFGAAPFRKYEKAVLKAIRAGLTDNPLVASWRWSVGAFGDRNARRRAGLLKGFKRPIRAPHDSDLERQTAILRLLGQGLSLREIHRRVRPQVTWQAFHGWCSRRGILREVRGRQRSIPSS